MEALKGVIYDRGKTEDGKYKTLICIHLISDLPINDLEKSLSHGEVVVMGGTNFMNPITDSINDYYKLYEPLIKLGTIESGILTAVEWQPDDLLPIGVSEEDDYDDDLDD